MRLIVILFLVLALTGCGSGSNGNNINTDGWSILARASADSGDPSNPSRVRLNWTPPKEFRGGGGSLAGQYEILRNGIVISTFALGINHFTDGADPSAPIVPGTTYTYRINIKRLGSTLPDSVSPDSGNATPLSRPSISSPTPSQPLNAVALNLQTVVGADKYVFEFSTQPNFTNKAVRGPISTTESGTWTTPTLNIASEFKGLPAGQPVYFRVGAANSQDNPGPLSSGTTNGDTYIYSDGVNSFLKQ